MLSIEEIRTRLSDRNLSEVSRRVGLSYQTIFYFCQNDHHNPSHKTVKVLSEYLEAEQSDEVAPKGA